MGRLRHHQACEIGSLQLVPVDHLGEYGGVIFPGGEIGKLEMAGRVARGEMKKTVSIDMSAAQRAISVLPQFSMLPRMLPLPSSKMIRNSSEASMILTAQNFTFAKPRRCQMVAVRFPPVRVNPVRAWVNVFQPHSAIALRRSVYVFWDRAAAATVC